MSSMRTGPRSGGGGKKHECRLEGEGMTCAACKRVQGARGGRMDAVRRLRTGARVEGYGARFAGGCTEYRG